MKTTPVGWPGWWDRFFDPLRLGGMNSIQPEKIIVLLTGNTSKVSQLFRFPHLLDPGLHGNKLVRYLACPDSKQPWFSLWLKFPLFRRLIARLLLKTVGDTKTLVLIHKRNPNHIEAQLHFTEELIRLGYTQVQVGLRFTGMEKITAIAAFGKRHGSDRIVDADTLKAEELVT